jgi:nucleoside-triphosphatase
MSPKILITGAPGVGKTTVIRKVAGALGSHAAGFYTEERRENGRRVGFDIVTLDGRRAPLSGIGISGKQRVGRYGVDVHSIDSVAVPAIEQAIHERRIIIIDEIGKMELFSEKFRQAVVKAFDSPCPVVAVIMLKSNPFADSVKSRRDIEINDITISNRESIAAEIAKKISSQL